MNKFLSVLIGLIIVLFGVNFYILGSLEAKIQKGYGAVVRNTQEEFSAGIKAGRTGQLTISSAGELTTTGALNAALFETASVGASTSTLGSAAAGHFLIGPSTATGFASTTAVTANSSIFVQQELTSPIGVTCNTTRATSTTITTKVAGNGFTVTNGYSPSTNPQCMAYWIIN